MRRTPVASPSATTLILGQVHYANRDFWRNPIATVFTLVFPLLFLLALAAVAGNAVLPGRSGVRMAQFLTPVAAAFAAVQSSFTMLAAGTARAREQGVLKRLHGTPLPVWAYLAGRVISAAWIALLSAAVMVTVAVVAFQVQVPWHTLPAVMVTLFVGISAFAALGLALGALAPSYQSALTIGNAAIILLAMVSDIFVIGVELPGWMAAAGWIFPLKHFGNALADGFNPLLASSFPWEHILVMAAWGAAGALVAARFFSWQPPGQEARAGVARARAAIGPAPTGVSRPWDRPPGRRRTVLSLLLDQVGYANRALARDPASVFFAIGFPVLLLGLFSAVFRGVELPDHLTVPQFLVASMSVYGIAIMAYVNLSESVSRARERGVLKRLRGTPLPFCVYLAGQIGSTALVAALTVSLVVTVGVLAFEVRIAWSAVPPALVTLMVGVACLAAVGLAVASLVSSSAAVTAITLATFLPLSMVSDIFPMAITLPGWIASLSSVFPLKHFADAMVAALDPARPAGVSWEHVGVMTLWTVAGVVVALVRLRPGPLAGRSGGAAGRGGARAPSPPGR